MEIFFPRLCVLNCLIIASAVKKCCNKKSSLIGKDRKHGGSLRNQNPLWIIESLKSTSGYGCGAKPRCLLSAARELPRPQFACADRRGCCARNVFRVVKGTVKRLFSDRNTQLPKTIFAKTMFFQPFRTNPKGTLAWLHLTWIDSEALSGNTFARKCFWN